MLLRENAVELKSTWQRQLKSIQRRLIVHEADRVSYRIDHDLLGTSPTSVNTRDPDSHAIH